MNQGSTYYDLLGVSQHADLAEISAAYVRISRELVANAPEQQSGADFQLKLLKQAYEVLSSPTRRSDYDAGLVTRGEVPSLIDTQLEAEAVRESAKRSPIRRLLTLIAAVMIIGMILQMSTMYMAHQRTKSLINVDGTSVLAEKAYLQDVYQNYGIRAASRAEADLLLADMRRKEQAARDEAQQKREQEEEARRQKRFEEDSRRLGAEVTANNLRAEQEAERARAEEIRRKEEKEQALKDAERQHREQEIARFRSRPSSINE